MQRSLIRNIINLYLYSSLHISLCCALLYAFSVIRHDINIDDTYLIFVFSSTLFTYSIHRIIGMKKVEKFAHKGRFSVITDYKSHIIFYTILSVIAGAYSVLQFDLHRISLLIGAGFISILYTLPVFGKNMRLRDFSYVKIFLIAGVWSYVTETIPLIENNVNRSLIASLFIERVCFFLAITIPFDIRDFEVDKANNVKTIPSMLGAQRATMFAIGLLIIGMIIEVWLYTTMQVNLKSFLSLILTYILSAILIVSIKNKKDDYFFSGLLDGTILLPYLFIILAGAAGY